jgi:hypothetical protein
MLTWSKPERGSCILFEHEAYPARDIQLAITVQRGGYFSLIETDFSRANSDLAVHTKRLL